MEIYGYFRQICLPLLAQFPRSKLICYAWLTVEWIYSLIDWSLYEVSQASSISSHSSIKMIIIHTSIADMVNIYKWEASTAAGKRVIRDSHIARCRCWRKLMTNRGRLPHFCCLSSITSQLHSFLSEITLAKWHGWYLFKCNPHFWRARTKPQKARAMCTPLSSQ